ncbi:hypothetical protein [Streptomyces sp. NPDC052225]|uniref:hypothetical protein n=1 Tax=Streptomyces sp. NPDC052225 TaxID=3154949 RepID=UPI003436A508
MADGLRSYRYVGPAELLETVRPGTEGRVVRSGADLVVGEEPFTYVVDPAGRLRIAPRRSEHVACAGGGPVLAAGEIGFVVTAAGPSVGEVSNQSTGYCPDLPSWAAVAAALDAAGIPRPDGFTHPVVFRRCERCQEHAIVREDDFVCVFCGADLPLHWNIDPPELRDPVRPAL